MITFKAVIAHTLLGASTGAALGAGFASNMGIRELNLENSFILSSRGKTPVSVEECYTQGLGNFSSENCTGVFTANVSTPFLWGNDTCSQAVSLVCRDFAPITFSAVGAGVGALAGLITGIVRGIFW